MAQVRYKVDISRVLKRLAEVKKVGADGIRELTLEYAKRAASKAIRTTPPNSLKNGGNGKRALEEHIARDIGGDPLETDVRMKRGEDGRPVPYAYPRKKRGGVLLGVRGKKFKGMATVSADAFLRSHTLLKMGRNGLWGIRRRPRGWRSSRGNSILAAIDRFLLTKRKHK